MMKKARMFVLVLGMAMVISLGSSAFAEEGMEMDQPQGGQGKGKMMGMMHKDSVVATSDGGVVVLSGPRLIKYDSELNMVKEVELPRGKKPQRETEGEQAEA